MKRVKSCIFECEYKKETGCGQPGGFCPVVEFEGGDCCEICTHSCPRNGELCCNLVFELFNCPHGIKNPLPEKELEQYRKYMND